MEEVFPRVLFHVFGIPVRNSVVATWVMILIIVGVVLLLRKKAPIVLEMLVEFVDDVAGWFIKRPHDPYLPFLGSLFVFILFANLIGIVPLIYTPTRDINTALALALVDLGAVGVFGIRAKGPGGYFKTFLTPLLPLDLIGYVARTASLTLRLFGNVIAGEVIVFTISFLVPVGVPLVMLTLTGFSGILQAYVFTVLTASYIASSVNE
jgi:F-type H+-transporting ATPase subunit a